MKKLITQFWFTSIIAFVLAAQLLWVLMLSVVPEDGLITLPIELLFPVLFVAGTVLHFRTK